jgi:DsbC/DsbD-like thiol-disulfide interchange protein
MLPVMVMALLAGQGITGFDPGTPVRARQYVTYVAESVTVKAGKPEELDLRFQVRDGFHVNSHRPASELLIPTGLKLEPAAGVKVGAADYPAGQSYKVGADTLSVYTGDFLVRLPVTAAAGEHAVDGELTYQACDRAACYPGKALKVRVLFTAR